MTARIFLKLMVAVVCVLAVSLFAVDYVGAQLLERLYLETLTRRWPIRAGWWRVAVGRMRRCFRRWPRHRAGITVVDREGRVLADSENDPAKMENHSNRPEIAEALAGRVGSGKHYSKTMGFDFYYVAVPLKTAGVTGGAVRVSLPLARVLNEIRGSRLQMIGTTSLAFLPAALLAALFARYASSRLGGIIDYAGQLAQGNFRARLPSTSRDEFACCRRS